MLNYLEHSEIYEDLIAQFNQNFFETNKQVIEKQKEMLKLERDTDYSEQENEIIKRHFEDFKQNSESSHSVNSLYNILIF